MYNSNIPTDQDKSERNCQTTQNHPEHHATTQNSLHAGFEQGCSTRGEKALKVTNVLHHYG